MGVPSLDPGPLLSHTFVPLFQRHKPLRHETSGDKMHDSMLTGKGDPAGKE